MSDGGRGRKLRLLHVLAETGYSGGEVQLKLLVEHFQRQGHDNHVLLAPGAKFAATARELGVPVHEAPLRRWWRPDLWWKLRACYRRVQPDVIHFACGRSLLLGGLAARGTAAKKFTIRRIDYPVRRGLLGGFRYTALCDHTIAICDAIAERLRNGRTPHRLVPLDTSTSRLNEGLMTIAAAFCWATGNTVTKQAGKIDMLGFVVWSSLVPPIPLLAMSLLFEGPGAIPAAIQNITWLGGGSLLFMAWIATLFGYGTWSVLLARYPAGVVAPLALLVPVSGAGAAALLLGETISTLEIAGSVLVFAGLLLNVFGPRLLARRVSSS